MVLVILLFLSLTYLSIFSSATFYYTFRNAFSSIKISNLYSLYRFINDLQLKKFFSSFKAISIKRSSNSFSPEKVYVRIHNVDKILLFTNILLLFNILLFSNIYSEAFNRIILFNKSFSPPDLLQYTFTPKELNVFEDEPLELNAYITGNNIPDYVFFIYESIKYKVPVINRSFSFKFKHANKDFSFSIVCPPLHHSKSFSVRVTPKVYFENYYLVVNNPLYIGGDTDTIYDFISVGFHEFSRVTLYLKWHGNASLHVNGSSVPSSNNTFTFNPSINSSKYLFELKNSESLIDSLVLSYNIYSDQLPQVLLSKIANETSGILSFTDDIGLASCSITYLKTIRGKPIIISQSNLNLENSKFYNLYFSGVDTVRDFDTLKLLVNVKDNCPYRNQIINKEFILQTRNDRLSSTVSFYDSVGKNFQYSLSNLNNLQQILDRLRNSVGNYSGSDYSKEVYLKSVENYLESLKSLKDNIVSKSEANKILHLMDSILSQITNPSSLPFNDPSKLNDIKKILELSDLLKSKIEKEQELIQSDILQTLKKEINAQINANNNLLRDTNENLSDESFIKIVESLKSNNLKLSELANKLSSQELENSSKQISDSLTDINNRYDSLNKPSLPGSVKTNQISKISNTYRNIQSLLDRFSPDHNDMKVLNYNTLVNLIKRGTLLSQNIEKATYSGTSGFTNQYFSPSVSQNFSYFEKYWSQYRDSLMTFIKENDLPVTFFIDNIFRIDQSSARLRRATKNNNTMEIGKNAGEIMDGLNTITLAITEFLNTMENDNSMQMEGQQCMKPKKGGNKGRPKPNPTMQDIIHQLQQLNQQMNSMSSLGNQKSIEAKSLLNLISEQQMLRETLSELMKQAENKSLGKLLQETIDDIKMNEKQLIEKRMIDNSLLNRQQKILTRLLDAQRAREEQEFDNKREAKDFGNFVRNWNEEGYPNEKASLKSINEILKPNRISIRKYYEDKERIFKTINK
ncbi:MAG: hypothetical protein ACP5O2_05010 [Bacteroidales bacterium]